mmetsp:Transcript_16016/g.42180  ORF Transcript_16016/g.42180 Transcript_16016/m.42180 type:complete len:233 (-) Transcript_16016:485-1183(-)
MPASAAFRAAALDTSADAFSGINCCTSVALPPASCLALRVFLAMWSELSSVIAVRASSWVDWPLSVSPMSSACCFRSPMIREIWSIGSSPSATGPHDGPPPPGAGGSAPIAAREPGTVAPGLSPRALAFFSSPLSYWPLTMLTKAPRHDPIVRRMRSDVSRLAFTLASSLAMRSSCSPCSCICCSVFAPTFLAVSAIRSVRVSESSMPFSWWAIAPSICSRPAPSSFGSTFA